MKAAQKLLNKFKSISECSYGKNNPFHLKPWIRFISVSLSEYLLYVKQGKERWKSVQLIKNTSISLGKSLLTVSFCNEEFS